MVRISKAIRSPRRKNAAAQDGIRIFTVGVGSREGELIPLTADQGGGVVKDEKGEPVKSRLDEGALKAIAAASGGAYVSLDGQGEGLDQVSQERVEPAGEARPRIAPAEDLYGALPMAVGGGLRPVAAQSDVGDPARRRPGQRRPGRHGHSGRVVVAECRVVAGT